MVTPGLAATEVVTLALEAMEEDNQAETLDQAATAEETPALEDTEEANQAA